MSDPPFPRGPAAPADPTTPPEGDPRPKEPTRLNR